MHDKVCFFFFFQRVSVLSEKVPEGVLPCGHTSYDGCLASFITRQMETRPLSYLLVSREEGGGKPSVDSHEFRKRRMGSLCGFLFGMYLFVYISLQSLIVKLSDFLV